MRRLILLLPVLLTIAGCTTPFSCGSFPGSGCQPVSDVYEKSNEGYFDYRKQGRLSDDARSYTFASDKPGNDGVTREIDVRVGRSQRRLNYLPPGSPLLSKPVVMRVLMNSWVDEDNDLNAGGFIFVRLKESEWYNN